MIGRQRAQKRWGSKLVKGPNNDRARGPKRWEYSRGTTCWIFLNHVQKIFSFTSTNKMNIQKDSAPSQLSNSTLLSLIRPPQVKLQLAKKVCNVL